MFDLRVQVNDEYFALDCTNSLIGQRLVFAICLVAHLASYFSNATALRALWSPSLAAKKQNESILEFSWRYMPFRTLLFDLSFA